MKKILILIALFSVGKLSAQSPDNPNVIAQKAQEEKGYLGSVSYKLDKIHTMNINYAITPKVPTTEITVSLHTPEAQPIGMYIANSSGKKIQEFVPSSNGYIKEGVMDISKLKPGKYVYVIHWEGDVAKEIPFEKK